LTEVRTGQGWDVHRLTAGRPLILGGVEIPSDKGLDGHSDADILSHAITDALLGAIAREDIGFHFPNNDPRWKGAASGEFLRHAVALVREQQWEIANIDSTVILEGPKLKEFRDRIRARLAQILGIETDRVSVKFKTAEEVGPVGRRESAEAQAIVTLTR
jgi:2-C-methyl-D-erythritol 2,4-cyclodiphosphate synthase